METTVRPVSKRRLAELEGYVAPGIAAFRIAAFVAAVAAVAWACRAVTSLLDTAAFRSPLWWVVPAAAVAVALYRISGRWTGGPRFRAAVRADLARGMAAAHRVVAVDAIEIEEQEDEGPTFFLLTGDGKTLLLSGQYLDPYARKGFPWSAFEILEAPESKVFFGLVPHGERLVPSVRRGPLSSDEYKRLVSPHRNYAILDVAFEPLKEVGAPPSRKNADRGSRRR
jgi:hypothetical protein